MGYKDLSGSFSIKSLFCHTRSEKMERKHFYRFAFDLICLLIFCIPLWAFNSDTVPVHKVGFFCSDTGIRYPYKNGQIPSYALFLEGFLGVCFLSCIVEWLVIKQQQKQPIILQTSETRKSPYLLLMFAVYRVVGE